MFLRYAVVAVSLCLASGLPGLSVAGEPNPLADAFTVDNAVRQVGYVATISDSEAATTSDDVVSPPTMSLPGEHGKAEPLFLDDFVSQPPVAEGCSTCGDAWGTCECPDACADACDCCYHCGPCVSVYGAYLYLRPRDADVSYGVPIDGPITAPPANNPIQIGRVGIVDPDYSSGVYTGMSFAWDACTSIDIRYTMFENQTRDHVGTEAPNVIRSIVSHPSSASAATDFLTASAQLDIDFDLADVALRKLWVSGCNYTLNFTRGIRYANLDQRFGSEFVNNGTENVATDIDFDGGGFRLGLEAERFSCHKSISLFARGYASFLAGRFRANYLQTQSFDPVVVDTEWEAGRIVPILDVELGANWTSQCGHWRLGAGYSFSSWFNTVKTDEFVSAVQTNQFQDLGDTLTFDGFMGHAEYRF